MNSVIRPVREDAELDQHREHAQGKMDIGLTAEQWKRLRELALELTPTQALWVSGYLAGLSGADGLLLPQSTVADMQPVDPEPVSATRHLTILYGTETGNCAALARHLADQARQLGLSPNVSDMADYKPRLFKGEQDLLIIVSTYGEGDPPQRAVGFFEFLEGRKAPKLDDLRYAVLALGDSAYEFFCEAGRRLDRRLEQLGARRLYPSVECDIDYEDPAATWSAAVLAELVPANDPSAGQVSTIHPSTGRFTVVPEIAAASYDKRHPFPAMVIDNIVLTGRGSSKETRHLELSLAESGLSFEPGDALGVVVRNDPTLVDTMLDSLALAADLPLVVKETVTTLGEALTQIFEITTATPRFIEHWAALTGASELHSLLEGDHAADRMAFVREHHIIDIIRRFPLRGLDPQHLTAGLRPVQPRLYSIASSLAATPDEAHLTVATVRYMLHGETRQGVASGHIADRAAVDTTLPVYVHPNPHFRLPGDDVPILMIGAGTGVAPYRAFLQEREIRGASGRAWLVFGERNFRTDFLYQTEWQNLLKDGVLTRMDVAFSRDRVAKIYVQQRLREQARDVYAWLQEGAHVYVCGDATHMAPDVGEALIAIVEEQGKLGRAAAEDYLQGLQRDGRYQRDVY